jgi:hypothetical protein
MAARGFEQRMIMELTGLSEAELIKALQPPTKE